MFDGDGDLVQHRAGAVEIQRIVNSVDDEAATAEEVAAKAEVGLRTVFRHFDDMEQLYREIAAAIEPPVWLIVERPFTSPGWRGRLAEMIERRVQVYERIMPFKLSAIANAHRSPFLRKREGAP